MILKTFELKKIKIDNYRFFLIYGNNKGFIEEIIEDNLKPILSTKISIIMMKMKYFKI